ncbi:potassium-transporting ATPase subunit KdpB [Staphylococcus aureus]|nr:potassium-transporting ATPase subunit KdpB [Staphylococcus aureus]EKF1437430.1 potassium-transporting ATPase subunit KdpB [Staphylococcus aureus]EKF1473166.1 potassium-transporting ATPase subunit KdpB [Staphylococcus aureus]EKF1497689.1 potassium-transporting ATPase subunit KdpB [Staphylococcus aureus]
MHHVNKYFNQTMVIEALKMSFYKLNPKQLIKNPIMFVVEVGMILTLILICFPDIFGTSYLSRGYLITIFIILLITILFANFSEAFAEGRGKAQADSLRQAQSNLTARLIEENGAYRIVNATELKAGQNIRVENGETIPADGVVINGLATVDESAITGESAPVIKESGGDFDGVIGGTLVTSDWLEIRVESEAGTSFLDKMIALVEVCGDVDVMILDKTGTITYGNRIASEFLPVNQQMLEKLIVAAYMSSIYDDTPEGKSIVRLAKQMYINELPKDIDGTYKPFTAETRMSGIITNEISVFKGAPNSMINLVKQQQGNIPLNIESLCMDVSSKGGTPLIVIENNVMLGVIYLKDVIKDGLVERFTELRKMGIETVMCTGDNALTAATIAKEAGVDRFVAECKPEDKIKVIKDEQAKGHIVAMTGDGTNDAPALAQANIGLAMNSGTISAKEAANLIDLDSNPTKLIEVVKIGKQLLMTRGALTTFSLANDVAKYFAILPALMMSTIPEMTSLNIMHLSSPKSAIISALIFNALIIVALIPIAMKGVKVKGYSIDRIFINNMLIYGLGGLIVPFLGIKLIDMIVQFFV